MKTSNLSRENYLIQTADIMRKSLFSPKGYKVPKVELSISWATSGNRGKHGKTGGQCFAKRLHENNINQIIISPAYSGSTIKGTLRILDILAHELVHAVDDLKSGHKKAFKDCATAIGLIGKMQSTEASKELNGWLRKNIVDKLGKFPHGKVSLPDDKKQTTRNIKVACDSCDFSFRTSKTNINSIYNWGCLACDNGNLQEL
tara:strand:+ start:1373 stop:1978 length:606 start_codon:yes stop_codon:yes gene_type:complete